MSAEPNPEPDSPINKALGAIVMIGIPFALIAMLGFTAVAFVKEMGPKDTGDDEGGTTVAAAGASAGSGTAAPAASSDGGSGSPAPEGIEQSLWATGEKAYATCAACHGQDGKGLKAGPSLMAPSLIGSETLLGDPDIPILVVLKGIKKENFDYMGVMAALGALPDDQIAGVLTYLRNNWGNSAEAITAEDVAAARQKYADVSEPAGIPRAKLEEIVEAHQ